MIIERTTCDTAGVLYHLFKPDETQLLINQLLSRFTTGLKAITRTAHLDTLNLPDLYFSWFVRSGSLADSSLLASSFSAVGWPDSSLDKSRRGFSLITLPGFAHASPTRYKPPDIQSWDSMIDTLIKFCDSHRESQFVDDNQGENEILTLSKVHELLNKLEDSRPLIRDIDIAGPVRTKGDYAFLLLSPTILALFFLSNWFLLKANRLESKFSDKNKIGLSNISSGLIYFLRDNPRPFILLGLILILLWVVILALVVPVQMTSLFPNAYRPTLMVVYYLIGFFVATNAICLVRTLVFCDSQGCLTRLSRNISQEFKNLK